MKTLFYITTLMIVAFFVGCSSLSVHHDIDKNANFAAYKTFVWVESTDTTSGEDGEESPPRSSESELIRSLTNKLLAEKGLKLDPDHPDIFVTSHSGEERKIDVTGQGYSYGGEYTGWQDAGIGLYAYKEGTLIIDLVDARTKNLVWRGVAQGVMLGGSKRERNKMITKALEEMFKKYPPQK